MCDYSGFPMLNSRVPVATVLLLVFFVSGLQAQPGRRPQGPVLDIRYGQQIYAEAVQLPSDSAGRARVDVFLRVAYDFMVFTRSESAHPDSAYLGGRDVTIHAREDGTTRQTANHRARVAGHDYESTEHRDRYVLFHQSFYLQPGTWDFLVSIDDRGSTKESTIERRLEVRDLGTEGTFAYPVSLRRSDAADYEVLGYDGTLAYAEKGYLAIPVSDGRMDDWVLSLTRIDEDGEEFDEAVLPPMHCQPATVLHNMLVAAGNGEVDDYSLHHVDTTVGALVILALPVEQLDVGSYMLRLRTTTAVRADSMALPIRIYWRNMPYSLRDIDFAIDVMKYILTQEQYDEMRDGDDWEKRARLRAYWREHDNTPDTEYNELMTEYFRRVDETINRYRTLFERNGALTDRGKVYILFGPPEDVQRVLSGDGPAEEVWFYPSLDKSFRFIDRDRNGDFRIYEE